MLDPQTPDSQHKSSDFRKSGLNINPLVTRRSILTDAETDKIDRGLIYTDLHWKKIETWGVGMFIIYTGVCVCTKQGVCVYLLH